MKITQTMQISVFLYCSQHFLHNEVYLLSDAHLNMSILSIIILTR